MTTSKKEQFIADFDYFITKLNLKKSWLDNKAIQFMNDFDQRLDEVVNGSVTNCEKCGHKVKQVNGKYLHEGEFSLNLICTECIKANKKIRHAPRLTEPVKYLPCGCTRPEVKTIDATTKNRTKPRS